MRAVRLVAVCLLLVTAGCSGPFLSDGTTAGPSGSTSTLAGSPTANPTASATPLPESARNPWRSSDVVVAIDSSATPERSYEGLVEQAVAYWNGPGRPNATYPATFRVEPNATDPDLVVVVRQEVDCATSEDVLGCAPRLSADARPPLPVTVEIAAGFSDETTLLTLKHEFGHVLGIAHGEPPMPLMEPRYAAATLPQVDAVNKSNPWTTENLRVYADFTGATGDRETLRFQLARAVEFYDAGAEGHVPSNVSFTLVENRSAAQVVVRFNVDREGCSTDGSRSCAFRQGFDPDRDDALEYYTNATVILNDIDEAAAGWHVGYWLGVLMGHDRLDERAPPFRDSTYAERRSEWWA